MHRPLIERIVDTTDAGTAVEVTLEEVQPGSLELIRDYSLYNESGESVTALPGVISLGGFVGFDQKYTVADGEAFASYFIHKYIREGERFAMQVTGTSNKSKVTMVVSGEVYSIDAIDVVVIEKIPPAA